MVLSIKDRINPHQTVDRMIGARFELSEVELEGRKDLRVERARGNWNGTTADLVETRFGPAPK